MLGVVVTRDGDITILFPSGEFIPFPAIANDNWKGPKRS
jgi:hypothetical protein